MPRKNKNKNKQKENFISFIYGVKTEVNYIKELFKYYSPKNHSYEIISLEDNATVGKKFISTIKNKADLEKNKQYDAIYHILDLEAMPHKCNQAKAITEYYSITQKDKKIIPLLQMPCIEIWFLLHFTPNILSYGNKKSLEKKLKEYVPKYNKTNFKDYSIFTEKTDLALKNYDFIKNNFHPIKNAYNLNLTNPMAEIIDLVNKIKSDT